MGRMKELYYSMPFCDRLKLLERTERDYRRSFEQAESVLGKKATVLDYHNLYTRILEGIIFSAFNFIYESKEEDNIKNAKFDETDPITNTHYSNVVRVYEKEKKKLDKIFDEFASKLETPADMSIKEFPENTTDEQKKILNELAGGYLIHPKLLANNKYKLFKERDLKDAIRKLYKVVPSYTHEKAYAFMTLFIETSKEGSIILNYCREIRKDSPYAKNV